MLTPGRPGRRGQPARAVVGRDGLREAAALDPLAPHPQRQDGGRPVADIGAQHRVGWRPRQGDGRPVRDGLAPADGGLVAGAAPYRARGVRGARVGGGERQRPVEVAAAAHFHGHGRHGQQLRPGLSGSSLRRGERPERRRGGEPVGGVGAKVAVDEEGALAGAACASTRRQPPAAVPRPPTSHSSERLLTVRCRSRRLGLWRQCQGGGQRRGGRRGGRGREPQGDGGELQHHGVPGHRAGAGANSR